MIQSVLAQTARKASIGASRRPARQHSLQGSAAAPEVEIPAAILQKRVPYNHKLDVWVATGHLPPAAQEQQSHLLLEALGSLHLGAPLQVKRDYGFQRPTADPNKPFSRTGREIFLTDSQCNALWQYVNHQTATLDIPGAQGTALGPLRFQIQNQAFLRVATRGWPQGFTEEMVKDTLAVMGYKAFSVQPILAQGVIMAGEFSITLLMPRSKTHVPKWTLKFNGQQWHVRVFRLPQEQLRQTPSSPPPSSWAGRVVGAPAVHQPAATSPPVLQPPLAGGDGLGLTPPVPEPATPMEVDSDVDQLLQLAQPFPPAGPSSAGPYSAMQVDALAGVKRDAAAAAAAAHPGAETKRTRQGKQSSGKARLSQQQQQQRQQQQQQQQQRHQ